MSGTASSAVTESLGLGWNLLLALIIPTLLVAVAGIVAAAWLWRRTRKEPSHSTGKDLFPGRIVTVRSAEGADGQAFVGGSWWSIHSAGATMETGDRARILSVEGLVLVVEPLGGKTSNEEDS